MNDTYIGVWIPDSEELSEEEWTEVQGIIAEALSKSKFHAIDFDVAFEEIP